MIDPILVASINAHAVLRNLEDLTLLDSALSDSLKGKKVSIRFSIPGVDKLTLKFEDGKCVALRGDGIPATINLRFTSAEHFNGMIKKEKMPIPTRGFHKIGFLLKEFTKATDVMEEYLRPDPERIAKDATFRRASTLLMAYTAFFSVAEVGNIDKIGKLNAARIPEGIFNVEIRDELSAHLIKKDGKLTCVKGKSDNADAFMIFNDIDTACGVLNGDLDSFACIGQGRIEVKGRMEIIDNLNKLLNQVQSLQEYLG